MAFLDRKATFAAIIGVSAAMAFGAIAGDVVKPKIEKDGSVVRPEGWREWVFIGTPLTPNALNGGEAPFPEFHNVYIEPSAYEYFKKTGKFSEGTQIAKELVLVRKSENGNDKETGASAEVSGVGYFQGEFQGLELAYKDSKRFPKEPGGWVYYSLVISPSPTTKPPNRTQRNPAIHAMRPAPRRIMFSPSFIPSSAPR